MQQNHVDGDLKTDILDYFDFYYSTHDDFEKNIVDDLPSEVTL